jgi:tripartite ATP-independent transporter DctP family solute receptor
MKKMECIGKLLMVMFAMFTFMFSTVSFPAFGAEKSKIIRLTHVLPESHPTHIIMVDYLKAPIESKSNGSMKVEIYPNGVLGGDRQTIESLQIGTLEMTATAAAIVSGFETQFTILDFPFLFKDKEAAYKALDGELGQALNDLLPEKQGIRNLVFMENGLRHITNNRKPIKTPEDLKGIKIRTMENPVHQAMFKLLGANPTPLSFSELYTALQQGTVDAQENPLPIMYSSKFYEVQKFCSLTGHVYAASTLLISETFWQSLSDEERTIIQEAAILYRDNQRRVNNEAEAQLLEELKKTNVIAINELTAEEKAAFMSAVSPLFDQMTNELKLDGKLVELVKSVND